MRLVVEMTIVSDSAGKIREAREFFENLESMLNKGFKGLARASIKISQEET
jgi:ATP-dependent protease HslVU (ClpYQ) peptidase subunit